MPQRRIPKNTPGSGRRGASRSSPGGRQGNRQAETRSYDHPEAQNLLRPDVGTQAQFKKKKPPQTYRYDSSLSPALDWDGQNPSREVGEARLADVPTLPLFVPVWFLDTDYNDLCFHVSQAFFPRTAAWDDLRKSLRGEFEDSVWDHLAGTESAPFEAGALGQVTVKVIDDRGNKLLVVKKLSEAGA